MKPSALKTLIFSCSILFITACGNDENVDDNPSTSKAIAVYNQAYQENYEADKIADILVEAKKAYVLIDPFADDVPKAIDAIKANGNQVGAYISIGTGETYRTDFSELEPYLVSTAWGQWPDEYFVKTTNTGVLEVMKARIDKIAAWGCDWVEFDNMDWAYDDELRNIYGFEVTEAEAAIYYQALCEYVHEKGMKCMAKNVVINASDFDGVLYESFKDEKNWWEQSGAQSFLDAGKLVIINHYNESNCGRVYVDYKDIYNDDLSFICEDSNLKKYVHFNQ